MERNATLLGSVLMLLTSATAQLSILPDRYGEPCKEAIGWFENQGQLVDQNGEPRPEIKYSSVGCVPKVALASDSKVSLLTYEHGTTPADPVMVTQVCMEPWGRNARRVEPQGIALKDWYQNFYLPQTAPNGASQVTGFNRVAYQDIFEKIDMHFYSGSAGQKMAFYMWPGSHPDQLQLHFTGQDSLKVDLYGNLKVFYDGRFYVLPQAVAYQVEPNNTIIPIGWNAGYELIGNGGIVSFNFSNYDPSLPLVFQVGAMPASDLDPLDNLCWSTYLGGTNGDQINTSRMDAAGNLFVAGYSLSDFMTIPSNPGVALINGGQVMTLAMFDPYYHLNWLTYFGASSADQQVNALALRGTGTNGSVYAGGYTTNSNLFGYVETDAYNLQSVDAGYYRRAVITKFDFSGAIQWSTYFGNGESEIHGMDVDASGRLHIVGQHNEANVPLVPLAGATNLAFTGYTDLLLARFNTNDNINWCSVYGGGYGRDMLCTADGGFVVSGSQGVGLPLPDQGGGAYHVNNAGGVDCTLLKFNSAAWCTKATYYGGDGYDEPALNSLALDPGGNIYMVGNTTSTSNFPLISGGGDLDSDNAGDNGFIAMFTPALGLAWSTFVNAKLNGVCTDHDSNAYPVGTTIYNGSNTFPVVNAPLYYNHALEGNHDGVVLGFNDTHHQFYGSFFGGVEGSSPDQVTTTQWKDGKLYIVGFTSKQMDVNTFFPLADPGLPAYYDGTYQYVPGQLGLNQNYQDAFVSVICGNSMIGIEEFPQSSTHSIMVGPLENGRRALYGLPDGEFEVTVYNAVGSKVSDQTLRSMDGMARLPSVLTVPGLYVIRIQGRSYRAFSKFVQGQ